MADIVAMPGVTAPEKSAGQQPCAEVIGTLEDLLEQAKSGDVQAVAVALVYHDNNTNYQWGFDEVGRRHTLFAAIGDLSHEFAASRSKSRREEQASDPA